MSIIILEGKASDLYDHPATCRCKFCKAVNDPKIERRMVDHQERTEFRNEGQESHRG